MLSRCAKIFALAALTGANALFAQPTNNPVLAHYGPGEYPKWIDELAWDRVIDMSTYANGANHFERFENARDELHAQGGGVLYYPAGEYVFDLPDMGYGPGMGPMSRGLMLKSGVVIRGADLVAGADQAVIRATEDPQDPLFANDVTHNLNPQTVFVFPTHMRGTDPVTGTPNSAGEVPSHWSFIGLTTGEGEETIADVHNIGVVNVTLEGGTIYWGYHTPRAERMRDGTWFRNVWKRTPVGAPDEETWSGHQPTGEHYMHAIHGSAGWHTEMTAGSGRLVKGVRINNGATWNDMFHADRPNNPDAAQTAVTSFSHYRFTGRITAHGSNIFVGNNVIAKPTKNFIHQDLQRRRGASANTQELVLFDYANHIGIDINKSNFGGNQDHPSAILPGGGYYFENVIVRDNWVFNRGNKNFEVSGQWVVLADQTHLKFRAQNMPVRIDHLMVADTWEEVVPEAADVPPPPVAPEITIVADAVQAEVGASATLSITATGTLPITFQWLKDGVEIVGANASSLVLNPLTLDDAGVYTVLVSNAATEQPIESGPITLVVTEPLPPAPVRTVFLETFDAVQVENEQGDMVWAGQNIADLGWNLHHSFGGHSMLGRDVGLMTDVEGQPVVVEFLYQNITATDLGDNQVGASRGFAQVFIDSRVNYGLAGTREGHSWPNAAVPGPHPETGEYYNPRTLAVLLWKEAEISGIDREELAEFSFMQGNRDAASHSFLPAVRIGDEWFVYYVDQAYLRDNVRVQIPLMHLNPGNEFNAETVFGGGGFANATPGVNDNGTNAQPYRFTWSESGWTRLVFDGESGQDSTVGMVLGDPLQGDLPMAAITAVGVFAPENITNPYTANGHRIDSIQLIAATPKRDLFAFTYNNEGTVDGRDRPIQAANWTGLWGNDAQLLETNDFVFADLSEGVVNPANDTPGKYKAGFLFVAAKNNITPNQFLVYTENLNVVNQPQLPQGGNPDVNPQQDWFAEPGSFTRDMGTINFRRLNEVTIWMQPVSWQTVDVHVAVQLEGEWYVAVQPLTNTSSAWEQHVLNIRSTDWFTDVVGEGRLGVDAQNIVAVGDMPMDAMLTAVGYYVNTKNLTGTASGGGGNPTWVRVDSISVLASAPPGFGVPEIVSHPESVAVVVGESATFSVEVLDAGLTLQYQWLKNGEIIVGALSDTYTIPVTTVADAGSYSVVVTSSSGSTESLPAVLTVLALPEVAPTDIAVSAAGGIESVSVTASALIQWTATSNVDWITVTAGASGNGNGTVSFNVAPNPVATERVGTLTVADVTITVTQAAATPQFDVFPDEIDVGAAGGSGEIEVEATPGAAWGIGSAPAWISFDVEGGDGDLEVTYTVAPNFSFVPRAATVVIAGLDVVFTQAARDLNALIPGLEEGDEPGTFSFEDQWLGNGYAFLVGEDLLVFSYGNGWWYVVEDSAGVYAFDYRLGTWLFTYPSIYPWVYSYHHEQWFGTVVTGNSRSFWVGDSEGWELVPEHDLAALQVD